MSQGAAIPRLIVLDDEPAMGEFVAEVGRRAGYDVRLATTAAAFVRELEEPADVVTIDLMVPGTDGVEILRSLSELPSPPEVILVSGMEERVIAGASRVATEFGLVVRGQVHKPFRAAELRALLKLPEPEVVPPPVAPAARPALHLDRSDLRRALLRDELVLAYQPQVSLKTRAWVGAEALVRWQHPEHGLLMPGAFLDLVNDELLASELTMTVLRRAAVEWAALRARLSLPLALSVNVHPLALSDPGFAALAIDALEGPGLEPRCVIHEVTEVAPTTRGMALSTLTRLRMRGFELSIDDFGTGHSSLERLNQVPFTELKIDRSFVTELQTNDWARTIAAQSITLARALGLRSVAEGVEDEHAMSWLRDVGCDLVQGYHIARPTWPTDLDAWAATWKTGRP
ncbi:MAG: EAL domain-containing response regulator [Chloroflexota bacterium]